MKTQTAVLIVAGSLAACVLMAALAVLVVWQAPLLDLQQGPQADNFFAWQDVPIVEPAPAFVPIAPERLKEIQGAGKRDLTFTGPYTHANLSLFLIHGPDTLKDKKIFTLHEALEQGLAVVHETGMSNLLIENRSGKDLFIQSGDIVKGGTQDRTIRYDLLLAPAAGSRVPVAAFCVEQGRCGPRGLESTEMFSCATEQLPGKQLRLANLQQQSQGAVWQGVSQTQANLSRRVGDSVRARESHTSLQLTLENRQVQQAVHNYLRELTPVVQGKKDVVGVAVAVNGRVHNIDLYASTDLFRTLWPRLVKSGAIEALAAGAGAGAELPTADALRALLDETKDRPAFQQEVSNRIHMIRQEGDRAIRFDTCDRSQQDLAIHQCILVR